MQDSKVQHYFNAFMGIYILRFEEIETVKRTATEVFFIDIISRSGNNI